MTSGDQRCRSSFTPSRIARPCLERYRNRQKASTCRAARVAEGRLGGQGASGLSPGQFSIGNYRAIPWIRGERRTGHMLRLRGEYGSKRVVIVVVRTVTCEEMGDVGQTRLSDPTGGLEWDGWLIPLE